MNVYWLVGCLPWLVIMITLLARLDEIKKEQFSKRWLFRRFGLILGFGASVIILAKPFVINDAYIPQATWLTTVVGWSWSLVLVTTPNMIPWHIWISGFHRVWNYDDSPKPTFLRFLGGEFIALRKSFKGETHIERRTGADRRNVGNAE